MYALNGGEDHCTPQNPCQVGEGDCDSNDDCAGNLECFQRERHETVPGVDGIALIPGHYDVCYDPNWEGLMMANNRGNHEHDETQICSDTMTCSVGQGECDADSNCLGNLKCFQREHGETVPGVEQVTKFFEDHWDICYDPNWRGQMPAINRASISKYSGSGCSTTQTCGIGQGTCASDDDCLGNLKCSDEASNTIPGVLYKEGQT